MLELKSLFVDSDAYVYFLKVLKSCIIDMREASVADLYETDEVIADIDRRIAEEEEGGGQ